MTAFRRVGPGARHVHRWQHLGLPAHGEQHIRRRSWNRVPRRCRSWPSRRRSAPRRRTGSWPAGTSSWRQSMMVRGRVLRVKLRCPSIGMSCSGIVCLLALPPTSVWLSGKLGVVPIVLAANQPSSSCTKWLHGSACATVPFCLCCTACCLFLGPSPGYRC